MRGQKDRNMYVLKIGDLYIGRDGLLTPFQRNALRVEAFDGTIRRVVLTPRKNADASDVQTETAGQEVPQFIATGTEIEETDRPADASTSSDSSPAGTSSDVSSTSSQGTGTAAADVPPVPPVDDPSPF